ncbi:hypothetical protein [Draconibacterium orientale]|uniref:hypothetical protein n=1 Tax=Draconibacterium orientale TaxID=1168034 RepID=UPI0029C037A6|nr:hypothetical protein [Draconibacterium orientale]
MEQLSRSQAKEELKQFFIQSAPTQHNPEIVGELASAFSEDFFDDFFTVAKRQSNQKPDTGRNEGINFVAKRIVKRYNWVIHDSEFELKKNIFTILSTILPAFVFPGNILAVTATSVFNFLLNIAYVAFHKGHKLADEQIQVLIVLKLLSKKMDNRVPMEELVSALNQSESQWEEEKVKEVLKSLQNYVLKNGTTTKFVDVLDDKFWRTVDV